MRAYLRLVAVLLGATLATTGCTNSGVPSNPKANEKVTIIKPGAEAQKQAQTALIKAKPGEIIEFAEGRFDFDSTLSLEDTNDITIRGKGSDNKAPAAKAFAWVPRRTSRSRTWPSRTPRATP